MTGFSPWLAHWNDLISLCVGAICTLGLYSVLYRENKIYRTFEHLFLGLATGYLIATIWTDVLLPKWLEPMWKHGQWWLAFALAAGSLYYFIYSKKYNWLARLVIGFFLGEASGLTFQSYVNDTWPQILSSFRPMLPHAAIAAAGGHPAVKAVTGATAVNNIIFMFILICVMSYFFFSFEQKHMALKAPAQLGRWLMMFTFGAIFGSTIMARLALLIDRMNYLMNDFGTAVTGSSTVGPIVVFAVLLVLTAIVLALAMKNNRENAGDSGDIAP